MKNKIYQAAKLVRENQSGLFKIAVLLILIYWTYLLYNINNDMPNLWGIESELSSILSKLDDINSTISDLRH